jgi:hypothetical protein
MNIHSKPGTKVKYAFPDNGWKMDKSMLEELGIKVGDILTVKYTNVYNYGTAVYFVEFPGKAFNSVNFANVEESI